MNVGVALPVGTFDYNRLQWVKRTVGGTDFWSSEIPYDRAEDFVKGEQERCHCEWTRAATGTNENALNGKKVRSYPVYFANSA